MPTYSSSSSAGGRPRPQPANDGQDRLIAFPTPSRSNSEPEPAPRRQRDTRELERKPGRARRARRRGQDTPWLQRNALSVAGVSVLVALLGLGFGLLQMITRPEPGPASLGFGQPEPTAVVATVLNSAGTAAGVQFGPTPVLSSTAMDGPREITASVRPIESNYTVASGDTLGQIAARFNTTVERIQALNNLPDPRALRIGTRLIIPPPL
ncbi:MAG: LysM peptidoglycan-binding domain-containing protein [Chloroflexi bacterium]|nr:LysM peptidoglycan-binding domain-containing protein [Chloroflexota bacterium]